MKEYDKDSSCYQNLYELNDLFIGTRYTQIEWK
jgi:hypothetical protein